MWNRLAPSLLARQACQKACRRATMEPHDVLWDCVLMELVLGYVSVQRVRLELALPGFYVPELLAAEVTKVNL